MSRNVNPKTAFLNRLEKTEEALSFYHRVDHFKQEHQLRLLLASQQLIEEHCRKQQAYLEKLYDTEIEGLKALHEQYEECKKTDLPENKNAFEEIDEQFSAVIETDKSAEAILTTEKKLSAEEKKEVVSLQQAATNLNNQYHEIALAGLLFVVGGLLIGLTHGIASEDGAGLIAEAFFKIGTLMGHHHNQAVSAAVPHNKAISDLLKTIAETEEKNTESLNDTWIDNIEKHCDTQRNALATMKSYLHADKSEHNTLIENIDKLDDQYSAQHTALEQIKKTEIAKEKTDAIKKLAKHIEKIETNAEPLIHALKAQLPDHAKSEPASFLARAKNFYHQNKKMFQFAGLMALTIVGIALTVTTGGIAGILGAAALGSVVLQGGKSIAKHVTSTPPDKAPEKKTPVDTLIDEWSNVNEKHSEEQAKSIEIISDALDEKNYAHVKPELKHLSEEYHKSAEAFKHLKEEAEKTPEEKIKTLQERSESIHKIDEVAVKAIHQVENNLSGEAKKESQYIFNRARNFYNNNKEITHTVGKVLLATAALTALGVLTGGIGVAVAVGFAATSWGISKSIEKIKKIKLKNEARDDEGESEGEKEDVKKSLGEKPH